MEVGNTSTRGPLPQKSITITKNHTTWNNTCFGVAGLCQTLDANTRDSQGKSTTQRYLTNILQIAPPPPPDLRKLSGGHQRVASLDPGGPPERRSGASRGPRSLASLAGGSGPKNVIFSRGPRRKIEHCLPSGKSRLTVTSGAPCSSTLFFHPSTATQMNLVVFKSSISEAVLLSYKASS